MIDLIKGIGPQEFVVITIILIVLFGNKIVVRLAKMSGETVKEFNNLKKVVTNAAEGNYVSKQHKEEVAK